MADNEDHTQPDERKRRVSEAAKRAKAEAEARRKSIDSVGKSLPNEVDGRTGPEPTRFGDWEVDGRATDF